MSDEEEPLLRPQPIPPDAAPGEYGPITCDEFLKLPEDVRQRRMKRAYEKLMALKGKIKIDIDIDELRGRPKKDPNMGKAKSVAKQDIPPDAAPGEFGPITRSEYLALPEDVRQRRAKRAYEKAMALKGKIHINIDIDELRGRNRR